MGYSGVSGPQEAALPWFPVAAGRCPVGAEPDLGVPRMLCSYGAGTLLPGLCLRPPRAVPCHYHRPAQHLRRGAPRRISSRPPGPSRCRRFRGTRRDSPGPGPAAPAAPGRRRPRTGPAAAAATWRHPGGSMRSAARLLLPSGRLLGAMTSQGRSGYNYAMTSRAVSFGTARWEVRLGGGAGITGISGIIRDHPRYTAPQRPARVRAVPRSSAGSRRRLLPRTSPERAPGWRLPCKAPLSRALRWQRGGRRRVAPGRSGWGPR